MYYQKKYNLRYHVSVSYSGYDYSMDRKIEKAINRKMGGAGCGLGSRDISFYFGTRGSIEKALKRIKRIKTPLSIEIYDQNIEDMYESEISNSFSTNLTRK